MPATHLVLLRHGVTDWNAEGRIQGHWDIELNALGREQAARAGEAMAHREFDAIYSSDLSRAHETARAVAAHHDQEITTDPRFREIHCGTWEGHTWPEVMVDHPTVREDFDRGIDFRRSETGETLQEMVDRALPAVREVVERHRGGQVLVASHGMLIQKLTQALLGLEVAPRYLGSVGNTALTTLEFHGDRVLLQGFNVPPH